MPTKTYTIKYQAPPAKILADIKAIKAAVLDLDKAIARSEERFKLFAVRASGSFKLIQASAHETGKGIGDMAGGNKTAFDMLQAELKETKKALDGVKASAKGAIPTPGTGGTPRMGTTGGGVPKKPGFISSAMDVKAVADMAIGAGRTAANLTAGTISDQADKAREYFGTSAEKAAQFQKDLAGWASLTGRVGVGKDAAQEVFSFAEMTGTRVGAAGQFLDRFEGSGQLGIEKGNLGGKVGVDGFTKEAQDRLKMGILGTASQFGARVNIEPDIAADIAAGVVQHNKIADMGQFAGQVAGLHYGVDQGKGDMGTLVRASLGAGATEIPSGRLSGLPEAGAWMGVWSAIVGKEGQVDDAHRQTTRLLNKSGTEGGADYLKSIGADKAKGTLEKLNLLAADVKAKGVTNVGAYLKTKGFNASEEVLATEAILPQLDTLNDRVKEAHRRAGSGSELLAKNAQFQEQPFVIGETAKASIETSEIKEGYAQQQSQNALLAAKGRLTNPDQPGGNQLINRGLMGSYTGKLAEFRTWLRGGGGAPVEDILIQQEAMRGQIAEAKGVGLDLSRANTPDFWHAGEDYTPNFAAALGENLMLPPQEYNKQFVANQARIDARRKGAGGDPGKAIVEAGKMIIRAGQGLGDGGSGDGGAGGESAPAFDPKRR